ncbi:hypothetical protein A2631_01925 [Candidatus Daviesbacteria bacterium RIFCSPHIGHO2_01_FULL_44_29]|uniref:Uncharacterized protein n=1 Tax=Candidatus Daviesbacteria bacterium RIFCSPHIGHO2_02_FULL_43_12 TaxID=1797776 RepID=A0A1F5KJP6_9BACT|nr:MAG: hypothetical protein A2631_01925 [Candidatus Daviesbacteria bacterium RIFCSPHIGHO2_01_FULL_44_29]OGE39567.1 MAG: hypothetical protein A3E86_01980 [Candidatus Daviesbacteria bacterium RIFCSPHIGHO2_12_FULL_47_45]OGE41156.1 MAG: hypothetical protein A3D25_01320 [Candidatus Daviesbacteria bacterium RIFCSPHIGHO2_02_FULL_43_12]OGE69355.1 MAG: hypothetical protein A3B55_03060 [Candidatus Daviesbacteria bacterium RIFCSPLOWO2_01_FULL_43_15]
MKLNIAKLLKIELVIGVCFFGLLGIIQLSNIRLSEVGGIWVDSARAYGSLIGILFGSFSALLAILCFELSQDINKYQRVIKLTAIWAALHALLEIWLSSVTNYSLIFNISPALRVWIPAYNLNLYFEAILLLTYTLTVFIWLKQNE